VTLPLPLSSPASPFFRFSGQRRSKLYPSSSLGLLALALPRELSQRTCRVLYALGEDGIGIVTLKQLLHQEDLSQREALPPQHLLLLIQDSSRSKNIKRISWLRRCPSSSEPCRISGPSLSCSGVFLPLLFV
jgi:hypothetical protein